MSALYLRIAAVLDDFAKCEQRTNQRDKQIEEKTGNRFRNWLPCEGCNTPCGGGLCPTCIEIAAGACRMKAKGSK